MCAAGELRGNTGGKGFSLRGGQGLKGLNHFFCQLRNGEIFCGKGMVRFFHAGQTDELVGEGGKAQCLTTDTLEPFTVSLFQFQNFRICVNDGKRGFDFMACVCNETALFFLAFRDRFQNNSGKNENQYQDGAKSQESFFAKR